MEDDAITTPLWKLYSGTWGSYHTGTNGDARAEVGNGVIEVVLTENGRSDGDIQTVVIDQITRRGSFGIGLGVVNFVITEIGTTHITGTYSASMGSIDAARRILVDHGFFLLAKSEKVGNEIAVR